MTIPTVTRFNTLEQWRLITNEISNSIGDLSAIYTIDTPNNTGVEYTNTSDTFSGLEGQAIQSSLNDLNSRKVKRSGDTISGHLNIKQNFNVEGTTKLEGPTNIVPISGNIILTSQTLGAVNNMTIGVTTHSTGKFTTLQATTSVNFATSGNIIISPTGSGNVTISPSVTGNVIINPAGNASTMDNVTIGDTIAANGTFDVLTAASVNIGATSSDSITAATTDGDLTLSGNGTGGVVIGTDNYFYTGTGDVQINGATTIASGISMTFLGTTGNFDMSARTSGTFKTGGGAVSINGSITMATTKSLSWAAASSGNFDMSTSSGTFATGTGAVTINGNISIVANKLFDMSASSGTFKTGTGAVSLNGATTCTSSIKSSSAADGVGYATGAGGTVTQGTSRSQAVTINKICGEIVLFNTAGSTTFNTVTVNNTTVDATDTVIVSQKSGTDTYRIYVTNIATDSFKISFATISGTTTEAPVFNFSVIKSVTS